MIESSERINELAAKQRTVGLTETEKQEQAELRQAYLREIRGQVLEAISKVTIVDALGQDVTPEKLIAEKNKKSGTTPPERP